MRTRLLARSLLGLLLYAPLTACSVDRGAPESTPQPTPEPTHTDKLAPQRPPTDTAGLGVYNGMPDESPDETTIREFGLAPDVANSYYQYDQKLDLAYESARMRRGTSPNIAISTKGTQLLAGIARGEPQAMAWLDGWIHQLAKLAKVDSTVPVYATLDQEFKVKVSRGYITGKSADALVYGKALDEFFKRANAKNADLCTTYWIVGYDREFEGKVATAFSMNPEAILFDPYANAATDTVTSITADDMTWIRSQTWYDGQTIALGEFGMPVRHGDKALANFYKDVPSELSEIGIAWAVLFNRLKDNDHQITRRPDGLQFPKAVDSFSKSMRASG